MSIPSVPPEGNSQGRHLQLRSGFFAPKHARRRTCQNALGLFVHLAFDANGSNRVEVNLTALAQRFGVTRRTVSRWLHVLAQDGYVEGQIEPGKVSHLLIPKAKTWGRSTRAQMTQVDDSTRAQMTQVPGRIWHGTRAEMTQDPGANDTGSNKERARGDQRSEDQGEIRAHAREPHPEAEPEPENGPAETVDFSDALDLFADACTAITSSLTVKDRSAFSEVHALCSHPEPLRRACEQIAKDLDGIGHRDPAYRWRFRNALDTWRHAIQRWQRERNKPKAPKRQPNEFEARWLDMIREDEATNGKPQERRR